MLANLPRRKNKLALVLILIGIGFILLGAPFIKPREIAIMPMHTSPEEVSLEILGLLLMAIGTLFLMRGIFMIIKVT